MLIRHGGSDYEVIVGRYADGQRNLTIGGTFVSVNVIGHLDDDQVVINDNIISTRHLMSCGVIRHAMRCHDYKPLFKCKLSKEALKC